MRVVIALLLLTSVAKAEDMKLVGYEVVGDCKYPSTRVVIGQDEHGIDIVVIKQDDRCE